MLCLSKMHEWSKEHEYTVVIQKVLYLSKRAWVYHAYSKGMSALFLSLSMLCLSKRHVLSVFIQRRCVYPEGMECIVFCPKKKKVWCGILALFFLLSPLSLPLHFCFTTRPSLTTLCVLDKEKNEQPLCVCHACFLQAARMIMLKHCFEYDLHTSKEVRGVGEKGGGGAEEEHQTKSFGPL